MPDLYMNIAFLFSGLILGIIGHKVFAASSRKIRKLQNQIKTKSQEQKALQNNLDNYFNDTNDLAAKLAEDYQTLISKLSEGTRKFSSFSKNTHYPAITNNLSNPGIEKNMPYTVDSLNKNSAVAITAAKSDASLFQNEELNSK